MSSKDTSRKGEIINNKYSIVKLLGHGENGQVYDVVDIKAGKHFVLKQFYSKENNYEIRKKRFMEEINFLKTKGKTLCGIIPIVDSCIKDIVLYYVMPIASKYITKGKNLVLYYNYN